MNFKSNTPCNNCPYRKDSLRAYWHYEEYKKLIDNDHEWGAVYGCHKNNGNVCVGWLMNQVERNIPNLNLRIKLIKEKVTAEFLESLHCTSELFKSILEMVRFNYKKPMSIDKRGFGSLDAEKRKEIASKGGKALAARTNMKELGRKGGLAKKNKKAPKNL